MSAMDRPIRRVWWQRKIWIQSGIASALLLAVATVRQVKNHDLLNQDHILVLGGPVVAILLMVWIASELAYRKQQTLEKAAEAEESEKPFDPMDHGFPVPPMPGQQIPAFTPRRARGTLVGAVVAGDEPAALEAGDDDV